MKTNEIFVVAIIIAALIIAFGMTRSANKIASVNQYEMKTVGNLIVRLNKKTGQVCTIVPAPVDDAMGDSGYYDCREIPFETRRKRKVVIAPIK